MPPKVSIPKLHSITYKETGLLAENIETHPDKHYYIGRLLCAIEHAIDGNAKNMSKSELVGALEFIKNDVLNS